MSDRHQGTLDQMISLGAAPGEIALAEVIAGALIRLFPTMPVAQTLIEEGRNARDRLAAEGKNAEAQITTWFVEALERRGG